MYKIELNENEKEEKSILYVKWKNRDSFSDKRRYASFREAFVFLIYKKPEERTEFLDGWREFSL